MERDGPRVKHLTLRRPVEWVEMQDGAAGQECAQDRWLPRSSVWGRGEREAELGDVRRQRGAARGPAGHKCLCVGGHGVGRRNEGVKERVWEEMKAEAQPEPQRGWWVLTYGLGSPPVTRGPLLSPGAAVYNLELSPCKLGRLSVSQRALH